MQDNSWYTCTALWLESDVLTIFWKGFRHVEKYGMLFSGIDTRRFDLSGLCSKTIGLHLICR